VRILPIILATYFLLGSFIPRTDFSQLTKVVDLLGHYQEHQLLEDVELSFMDFLCMHFIHLDHHKASGHDHESLPLKSMPVAIDLMVNNLFVPEFGNNLPKLQMISFQKQFLISEFIFNIFIPPTR